MRQARLLLLTLLATALMTRAPLADEPVRVTTDTVEYCGHLAARLLNQPAVRQDDVHSVAGQALRLCQAGHTRTGIAKLRRALRTEQAQPQAQAQLR